MGATIYIVEVKYFDNDKNLVANEKVNRIFLDEDNAKGFCNLMNQGKLFGNPFYSYKAHNICTKDYKRFA